MNWVFNEEENISGLSTHSKTWDAIQPGSGLESIESERAPHLNLYTPLSIRMGDGLVIRHYFVFVRLLDLYSRAKMLESMS